jgi:hypothetical protein
MRKNIKNIIKNIKLSLTNFQQHNYHMVDKSPWPFLISIFILFFVLSILMWFHYKDQIFFIFFLNNENTLLLIIKHIVAFSFGWLVMVSALMNIL